MKYSAIVVLGRRRGSNRERRITEDSWKLIAKRNDMKTRTDQAET